MNVCIYYSMSSSAFITACPPLNLWFRETMIASHNSWDNLLDFTDVALVDFHQQVFVAKIIIIMVTRSFSFQGFTS